MTEGTTTKVDWGDRSRGAEEKYRKGMERYTYLSDPKYSHKLEQLFLMVNQGYSGKFVNNFFEKDSNIISMDLDFMRSMALVAGEDFVIDELYKKQFSVEEAIMLFQEYLCREKYKQFPQIEELLREKEMLQERFRLQMEFLEKERINSKSYHEEILHSEQQKKALEMELLRTKLEQERDAYLEQAKRTEEENENLKERLRQLELKQAKDAENEERELLLAQCEELKNQLLYENDQHDGQESRKKASGGFRGFLQRREEQKIRKEKSERNRFIMETIKNRDFSVEQLNIILRAVSEDLSMEELRQICDPAIPVKNMETMELYFQKGRKSESVSYMTQNYESEDDL